MAKFRIGVKEIHTRWVTVEVDDPDDVEGAIAKVQRCEGTEDLETEFDYTLDSDKWKIEPVEDDT